MAYVGYAVVWIATAAAVSFAVWMTGSAAPLLAMIIPLFLSVSKD